MLPQCHCTAVHKLQQDASARACFLDATLAEVSFITRCSFAKLSTQLLTGLSGRKHVRQGAPKVADFSYLCMSIRMRDQHVHDVVQLEVWSPSACICAQACCHADHLATCMELEQASKVVAVVYSGAGQAWVHVVTVLFGSSCASRVAIA
jgi:hypothetical protein